MLGKASIDQPVICGSGAISHAYIQHPPLRCNIPGIQDLHYDDGNKLLLAPTSDQILSWKVGHSAQLDPPSSDSVGEGPVLSIRYSLDRKVIGIQRSNHEIQFKNRETGESFSRRCKTDTESILGFFWTDCPSCDIILIKTSGIDLLSYEPELNNLRLVEAKRFNIRWYVYTHESRMVLLASGMQCTVFFGFQFSAGGIIRLPKFEMAMAKEETNSKPVLAEEDIYIVTVYGRIYCLQLDRVGMVLNFYRFYRDAVVQQGALPIYSSKIAVSVIDNVVLVHQVDAKVVILYDIFLDSLSPISAPLPLLLRGSLVNNRATSQIEDDITASYGAMIYSDSWKFLVPDLICDVHNGLLWRIYLDLEAIAASSSDIPAVLEFLQHRRSDPNKIKMLCLSTMRAVILERRPTSLISRSLDAIVSSYSHSIKFENTTQGEKNNEILQQAVNPHISASTSAESSRRTMDSGKSVEVEIDPQDSSHRILENEQFDHGPTSSVNRALYQPASDSDGNQSGKGESDERSFQVPNSDLGKSLVEPEGRHGRISDISDLKQEGSQFTNVTISPDDMYHYVFVPVEDELAGDPAYLVAIILEFLRSASRERIKVHPNLYIMMIQLLTRANRNAELALFVLNKILEPSKEVAMQLLVSGQQNSQIRRLGADMLMQLSLHHDFVSCLLKDGYYLEALRYARKHKVITVHPSLFLEAAVAANNAQHLSTVLRFFSDFTPSFKTTLEYDRYCRILTEMV